MVMLESLKYLDCPITLVEAVMPDAERLSLPSWVNHYAIPVNLQSTLFLKENLYNIGIKKSGPQ